MQLKGKVGFILGGCIISSGAGLNVLSQEFAEEGYAVCGQVGSCPSQYARW